MDTHRKKIFQVFFDQIIKELQKIAIWLSSKLSWDKIIMQSIIIILVYNSFYEKKPIQNKKKVAKTNKHSEIGQFRVSIMVQTLKFVVHFLHNFYQCVKFLIKFRS